MYPRVKWNDLRLRDNTNQMQMFIQLQQSGIISQQTLLEQFDLDYDIEIERIRSEQVNAMQSGQLAGGAGGAGGGLGGLGGLGGMGGGAGAMPADLGGAGGMPGGAPGEAGAAGGGMPGMDMGMGGAQAHLLRVGCLRRRQVVERYTAEAEPQRLKKKKLCNLRWPQFN
jgi:hypothetical protein